jgi:NADH dehydrogenase [ubiquinone] 1 alpha subcomplex assembly factor 7
VHLVEISPALQQLQRQTLESTGVPMLWHDRLEDVPDGPAIILANEFFDARPVHQAVKQDDGWHERVVSIDKDDNFSLGIAPATLPHFEKILPPHVREAPVGSIYEWCSDSGALEVGRRVARSGGAALIIDYGHTRSEVSDTVQAVGAHAYANPLVAPGLVDLTAHVDFQALAQAAESIGARIHGPLQQGEFLRRLGIHSRAAALKKNASPEKAGEIDGAVDRLTGSGARKMGVLFKVIGIADPKLGPLPGLET